MAPPVLLPVRNVHSFHFQAELSPEWERLGFGVSLGKAFGTNVVVIDHFWVRNVYDFCPLNLGKGPGVSLMSGLLAVYIWLE